MTTAELDEVLSRYLREALYIAAVIFFLLGFQWIGGVCAAWALSIQLRARTLARLRDRREVSEKK